MSKIAHTLENIGAVIADSGAKLTAASAVGEVTAIAGAVSDSLTAINAAFTEGKLILAQAEADPAVWEAMRERFGAALDGFKASVLAHPGL